MLPAIMGIADVVRTLSGWSVAAAVTMLGAVHLPTFAFNIPLNNALQLVSRGFVNYVVVQSAPVRHAGDEPVDELFRNAHGEDMGLEDALIAWNRRYESRRPHQALGQLTPETFYQRWLEQQTERR